MSIVPAIVLVIAGCLSFDAPLEARIVSSRESVVERERVSDSTPV